MVRVEGESSRMSDQFESGGIAKTKVDKRYVWIMVGLIWLSF